MKSYDALGYTADGDTWCADCACKRYGVDVRDLDNCDPEGIWPIFADSEWDYPIWCADCEELLPVRLTSDGIHHIKELAEASGTVNGVSRVQDLLDSYSTILQ